MIDHSRLESALAELAQLLLDDFVVADVLQRLCGHVVQVLPVVDAGVSVDDGTGRYVAWTAGSIAAELEVLQLELGEGPCHDVYASGEPVCADLSAAGERWPRYTPEADRLRVRSFAALPLRAHGKTWGVLDLYGASSEALSEEEMAAARTLSDTAAAYVTAAHDRHARRLAEDELRLQALHDPLTGLPNRLLMLDRLKHALTGVARHPGSVGLLFLDLDGFKQVNDAHGHIAGDQLLVAVAERLAQTLRPTDTLARLGGDEFVVLCEDLHRGGGDLKAIAERVLAGLAAPIALPGHAHAEVLVRASMGAVHPAEDENPEEVLRHADRAMYVAKRRGGGVAMSDRRLDGAAAAELVTRTQLENALQREELELAFQPVVALNGSQWHGVEALLRWKHPSAGLLSARQFLPVIERTGLMLPIGSWVLQEACRQLPSLQPAGASADWFLSVNVSVSQLLQPSFADEVGRVLERSGTDTSRLMLEVTETALLPRSDVLTASLRQLSAMGVRVALDDFGTGYSSMAHLKYLPADVLKIDKMFIDGLGADRRDEAVVRGTITLAHALGLRVIAEGIEDIRQHELLVAAECDAAQGYLYARPEGRQVSV